MNKEEETIDLIYYKKGVFYFKTIFSYDKIGQIFGEKALESKEGGRKATCYCSEPTILLSLTKELFDKYCSSSLDTDSKKKIFLQNFFEKMPDQKLINIAYMLKRKETNRQTFIFKQGNPVGDIFFVQNGMVELTRTKTKKTSIISIKSTSNQLRKKNPLKKIFYKAKMDNVQKLGICGPLSSFGDEYLLRKLKMSSKNLQTRLTETRELHNYSAQVITSNSIIYTLSVEDLPGFFEILGEFKRNYINRSLKRLNWYKSRRNETQIVSDMSRFNQNGSGEIKKSKINHFLPNLSKEEEINKVRLKKAKSKLSHQSYYWSASKQNSVITNENGLSKWSPKKSQKTSKNLENIPIFDKSSKKKMTKLNRSLDNQKIKNLKLGNLRKKIKFKKNYQLKTAKESLDKSFTLSQKHQKFVMKVLERNKQKFEEVTKSLSCSYLLGKRNSHVNRKDISLMSQPKIKDQAFPIVRQRLDSNDKDDKSFSKK